MPLVYIGYAQNLEPALPVLYPHCLVHVLAVSDNNREPFRAR